MVVELNVGAARRVEIGSGSSKMLKVAGRVSATGGMRLNEREDLEHQRKSPPTSVGNVCTTYNDRVLRNRNSEHRP